jgi:hypothetical protein
MTATANAAAKPGDQERSQTIVPAADRLRADAAGAATLRVAHLATQGTGSGDEARIAARLEGDTPWDGITAMARFLAGLNCASVSARRARVPRRLPVFDFVRRQHAVNALVINATEASRAGSRRPKHALTDQGRC